MLEQAIRGCLPGRGVALEVKVPLIPWEANMRIPFFPLEADVRVPLAQGSSLPLQLHLGETEELHSLFRQQRRGCFWSKPCGFFLSFPDFDECTVYGTCSQTCTNTEGSYTCSCVEGYLLQPDNRSCKAKNGESLSRGTMVLQGSLAATRALPWCYSHGIEVFLDLFVPSLPSEPVDRPPVLLIANSQNILATYLSGAPVPNITPTSAKQTTAMDFNYVEDTVCWVHVGDSASQTILKCAKIPNLKGFVEERSINISLSLHRECPLPSGPSSCSSIPNSLLLPLAAHSLPFYCYFYQV